MKDLQLPDFMKYSDKYSATGFVEKISHIAKRAGAKLVYAALILYYTLQSKDVPLKDKAIIIGALGYLISPLDVIPDAIPIAGLGDDVAVLLYVLRKIKGDLTDDVIISGTMPTNKKYSSVCKGFSFMFSNFALVFRSIELED